MIIDKVQNGEPELLKAYVNKKLDNVQKYATINVLLTIIAGTNESWQR